MKHILRKSVLVAAAAQLAFMPVSAAMAAPALEAGSRLYLTLDEGVTSARGEVDVGSVVRCRVWRDVESRGVVFIKAGSPAACRVDKIKRRNMGGSEGKVSIGGVEVRSVDGQMVMLSGGYNKEGSGHKALVWTAGLILFLPILFIPGGNAELPPGTVFDVATVNELKLAETAVAVAPRVVNLSSLSADFGAEFMLDDFIDQPKHDTFKIKVSKSGALPSRLFIDNVNGKPVPSMPLVLTNGATADGESSGIAAISAKVLAKHFARGINRFDVAYEEGGERKATEVVMDVQM